MHSFDLNTYSTFAGQKSQQYQPAVRIPSQAFGMMNVSDTKLQKMSYFLCPPEEFLRGHTIL